MSETSQINLSTEEVIKRVEVSLQAFLSKESYLLQVDAHERSITHKLAEHLQCVFPDWHVDCEYNREGHEPKHIFLPKGEHVSVFPDIIVHRRGERQNLLIIEAKKSSAGDNSADFDRQKLQGYLKSLRYQVGIFIVFGTDDSLGAPYRLEIFSR